MLSSIALLLLARPTPLPQHEMPAPSVIIASPANHLFKDVGPCDLPVSTDNELARSLTKQGFALIHCFWYNEAVRSLRAAVAQDPNCAIAYAGLALSLSQPRYFRAQFKAEAEWASARSVSLARNASEAEQTMIAAIRTGITAGRDAKAWARAFETAMAAQPDLEEPKVILAGMLFQLGPSRGGSSEGPDTSNRRIIELCEQVIKRSPDHAAALHYHVHVCEGSEPERALNSAKKLTRVAIDSPHMVHMPGHIFYRVGDYEAANAAFYEADRKSIEYARGLGQQNPGQVVWDYGHNRSFWAASLVESARFKEMREKLPGVSYDTMAWLRAGNWKTLYEQSLRQKLTDRFGPLNSYVAAWAAMEREDWGTFVRATVELKGSIRGDNYSSRIAKTMVAELEGARLVRQRQFEEGFARLREAVKEYNRVSYQEPPVFVRLPHETLGAALTARGEYAEAIEVFQAGLKERPNSVFVWIGLADAYRQSGDTAKAKDLYDKIVKSDADRECGPVTRATVALAEM